MLDIELPPKEWMRQYLEKATSTRSGYNRYPGWTDLVQEVSPDHEYGMFLEASIKLTLCNKLVAPINNYCSRVLPATRSL